VARITILSWSGGGNQPPAIAIARVLRERGHSVSFAGYAAQRSLFERKGFAFKLLERAATAWRDGPPEQMMTVKITCAWASAHHLHDVDQVAIETRPDVLIVDCMMFGALAASERNGIPTVVLVHSAPGALLPPGGILEAALLGPVNRVRATAGLPHVERLWTAWQPFPAFSNSIRQLDEFAGELPRSIEFVGPLNDCSSGLRWQSPWAPDDPRPLVLASFSTGPYWDQASRIRRTLEGLADRDCRVLVTSSGADLGELRVPKNAIVVNHVPHHEVLPRTAMTVTHAGHGTVITSLAHGVPLLCLPNRAADQPMLAARIASLGVGLSLDGDVATPAEIGAAVDSILRLPSFLSKARHLATKISEAPGTNAVVRSLEQIANSTGGDERRLWR
jgi:UDP:flavonoid glycosyltransferase YjiC (YdhE family)